jgi:hypothetical protein
MQFFLLAVPFCTFEVSSTPFRLAQLFLAPRENGKQSTRVPTGTVYLDRKAAEGEAVANYRLATAAAAEV